MRSFTLIELAVVISIVLILSTFAFPNFREINAKFALDRTVYKLSQDLRNAEEMSMSSQTTDPAIFGSALFPAGGWGIYFKEASSSYILFADCDGDGQYDATGHPSTHSCAEAEISKPYPEKFKEISVEAGIKISALIPKYAPDNSLAITFFPPDPAITIYPSATTAFMTLVFKARTETVSINLNGLIEIQ